AHSTITSAGGDRPGGVGGNGAGGGLYVAAGSSATLMMDTLSANQAKGANAKGATNLGGHGSGAGNGVGGGLFVNATNHLPNAENTLIAANTATAGTGGTGSASGPDVSGTLNTSLFNLIGNSSGYSASVSAGDILNPTNVGLDTNGLDVNGGAAVGAPGSQQFLQTIALKSGSQAIHAGISGSGVPTTDERGAARGSQVDIGAFQSGVVAPQAIIFDPIANQTYGDGFVLTATAS